MENGNLLSLRDKIGFICFIYSIPPENEDYLHKIIDDKLKIDEYRSMMYGMMYNHFIYNAFINNHLIDKYIPYEIEDEKDILIPMALVIRDTCNKNFYDGFVINMFYNMFSDDVPEDQIADTIEKIYNIMDEYRTDHEAMIHISRKLLEKYMNFIIESERRFITG